MRRYLRLLGIFYKAALLTDLEYRANFIVNAFLSLISASWSVAGVAIFFLHTDEIRGWRFHELMIVLGLFLTFLGVIEMLLVPNVQDLMEHIRLGTLDFILTKPINSQFHASLRRINIWRMVDVLLGLGVVSYGIAQLPVWPAPTQFFLFLVLCLCGIIILYCLVMLLATSAFWFVQLENVMELLYTFFEAGRFPITIFPAWVRILLTFVVPVAFITTVPASVLLGRLNGTFALYSLGVTAALFMACVLFWSYAVRHYSSASS
jgi:ABC-2 type transport system permease protein